MTFVSRAPPEGTHGSLFQTAMRFAYIDSQGNEVAIPSVDALALRVELGAIKPDTELYDAQADRWGPASTHEIFHTLSRAAEDDAYIAPLPPPPRPPPPPPPPAAEPPQRPVPEETTAASSALEVDDASEVGSQAGAEEQVADRSAMSHPEDQEPVVGKPTVDREEYTFDLVDGLEDPVTSPEADPAVEQASDSSETRETVAGLELEDSLAGSGMDEEPSDLDGGLDLETEMDFLGGTPAGSDLGGGLDLEDPMSEFSADAPPAWMEQDGPAAGESVMDFSSPSAEASAPPGAAAPVRERREPRSRPSRPRTIRRRSGSGPLVALLVVVVVVAGGYYAWQTLGLRQAGPPSRPPVVIPQIPAELVPQMQELATLALQETFDEVDARSLDPSAPSEPREEWLAGVYLANASQFSDVEAFWLSMGRFAEVMRDSETTVFHGKYLEQAESAELEAPVVAQLTERADSGFLASRQERLGAYALLSDLSQAALDLHAFLVANEANIAHTPATGLSGNPVEEAVPNSPALSDQMWSMVEDLTNAQDALLGTLDRVNRTLLLDAVRARLEQIGIR